MSQVLGIDTPEAFEIGSYDGIPIRTTDERHMLLFGGNGSGKGTRILASNLLRMGGEKSLVVIDPKGELAAISAEWRRKVSDVVILNPFGVLTEYQGYEDLKGVGFNPLAPLDPDSENFAVNTSLLVEAMIPLDDKQTPHWNNSARALVTTIMMYCVLIARKHGKVPTMARVRELLCMASDAPHRGNDFQGAGIPKLARVIMKSSMPSLKNKAAQFTDWNNEISGIASTAKIQTECFDDPQIAKSMASNDFDFRALKRKPTTIFLIIPPEMLQRHGKWLRVILTSALQASMRPRQRGEPRILFMLDEFAALGHLQIIETVWALARGYGIQMLPVFQDLNQLKTIYSDRWETFIANAGITMSFRANDLTTAGWLSKRMGETTRMMETENESESESSGSSAGGGNSGRSFSTSRNRSPVKVPYMAPQELFGLQDGEMVAFMSGDEDVWHIQADAYYEIESRDLRARPNPYFHDVPLRKSLPGWGGDSKSSSAPVYEATVKWFSRAKGYGVVALSDGIAVLHADVLHKAGYSDIRAWATLRVHLAQGQGGRIVTKILSIDESKTYG